MNEEKNKIVNQDLANIIRKYKQSFEKYGYSPKTLGWDKGKQNIRFEVLLSFFNLNGKSILDLGCGFGDLNISLYDKNIDSFKYLGVDLVGEFIDEGRRRYPQDNIKFLKANFLEYPFKEKFDIIVASGIFNDKFISGNNDIFVEKVFEKTWSLCRDGFAFDFLSDKVDYKYNHTYHNNPEHILKLAYKLSRNITLRNDYMPFEFCIYVCKDDSFDKTDTIFNNYKKRENKF